jgi:sugar phosphate isomerase/epimerase
MTTSHGLTRRDFLQAGAALAVGVPALSALSGATEPAGYQIGCYTRPWDQFEYRVALDGIAEAGFQYAGLMTAKGKSSLIVSLGSTPEEVSAVAKEVASRGLKTLSLYAGDFPVAKSVEAGIAGLKKLVDHSALCGCPNLLLGGTADPKLFHAYYQVVAECCDYAAAKGVGLSVKPHGGLNATGPQCRKIIETVGHRNFRVWYDGGNIMYYSDGKLDPVDDVGAVAGLVAGLSVKDFKPPKDVFVTPGKGRVNFPAMMAGLRKGGFTSGPLIVECLDRGDSAAKITAQAKEARRFLIQLTGRRDAQ